MFICRTKSSSFIRMTSCFNLFVFLYLIHMSDKSFGEVFTSMMSVNQAVLAETQLIDHLRIYIERETQRLHDIKRFFSRVTALHGGIYNESSAAIANPLVAFKLVKRLQSEWLNVVYSSEAEENLQALREGYRMMEDSLPKLEDVQGAAQGLMRLQDVYDLRVEGLVRGHFQRITNGNAVDIYKPSVSYSLSGDDCFLVGKVAYDLEDYYHSVQWFEEAVRLFRGTEWSPENEGTLENALDHLAFSHFKTGNISYALHLSQELLLRDPINIRILLNVEKYEKLLVKSPPVIGHGLSLKRPDTTYLRTRDVYEKLCQTRGSQPTHYQNPKLFCDYFTNGNPGLLLQPMKREVISQQPYVVLYHDFITHAEAKSIRDSAVPGLRRSVVASGVNQATAEYRISKSAWLKESVHAVVGKMDQRITMVSGLNVHSPYAEFLQVVNYGIGGHYEPHFDHATSDSSPLYKLKTGNRVATFMIYLSSVEAGGCTTFIYANFSVPVVENTQEDIWKNVGNLRALAPIHFYCMDKTRASEWVQVNNNRMLLSSGGIFTEMAEETMILFMLVALSLLVINGLLISGSMSTGRSSRDPAASILKSEHTVGSERSSRTTRNSRVNDREGATEDIWERLKNKGLKTDDSSFRKRHMEVERWTDGLP